MCGAVFCSQICIHSAWAFKNTCIFMTFARNICTFCMGPSKTRVFSARLRLGCYYCVCGVLFLHMGHSNTRVYSLLLRIGGHCFVCGALVWYQICICSAWDPQKHVCVSIRLRISGYFFVCGALLCSNMCIYSTLDPRKHVSFCYSWTC